jgi:hypothetical protein
MTQKIRILAMGLLALALALSMAGIGGAVAALAATTPASLAWTPTNSLGTYDYGTLAAGATKSHHGGEQGLHRESCFESHRLTRCLERGNATD